jgi:hypothetical protein
MRDDRHNQSRRKARNLRTTGPANHAQLNNCGVMVVKVQRWIRTELSAGNSFNAHKFHDLEHVEPQETLNLRTSIRDQ